MWIHRWAESHQFCLPAGRWLTFPGSKPLCSFEEKSEFGECVWSMLQVAAGLLSFTRHLNVLYLGIESHFHNDLIDFSRLAQICCCPDGHHGQPPVSITTTLDYYSSTKQKKNIKNFKCFQNKWMNLKHTTSAYIVSYYNVLCHHLWILNYYLQNIVPALKLCKKKHLKCFDFSFSFALDRYPILLKQSYFPPKFELPWMKNIINL